MGKNLRPIQSRQSGSGSLSGKAIGRLIRHMRRHAVLWVSLAAFLLLAWSLTGTSCTLRSITGLPCPGCGLTRALIAVLRGDLAAALQLHPLFWLAPPVLAAVLYCLVYNPALLSAHWTRIIWIALAVLFIAVYIIRMILFFPDSEPLTWNADAFLPRIWRLLCRLGESLFSRQ